MASIHETAEGLHAAGVMDKRTMRDFDEMCLTPVQPLKPTEIRALRLREGASQGGFRPISERDNGSGEPVGTR
jgi:putative transcriptional regulator